jgi:hypothetical protein
MRMWNIDVRKMCNQHVLGEHFEIHKLIGNLRNSRTWAESLTLKGFLEPQNALARHDKLAQEMCRRGMKHLSPLDVKGVKLPKGKVNIKKSKKDLIKRCKNCRKLLAKAL